MYAYILFQFVTASPYALCTSWLQLVFQNVGADGTVYAELAMMKQISTSTGNSVKHQTLNVNSINHAIVYARIDHTATAAER